MKIFADKNIKHFFLAMAASLLAFLFLSELLAWLLYGKFFLWLLLLFSLMAVVIFAICFGYFYRQNRILEEAVAQINAYLDGDVNARIECDDEGELYRLFHSVNSLASVNAPFSYPKSSLSKRFSGIHPRSIFTNGFLALPES